MTIDEKHERELVKLQEKLGIDIEKIYIRFAQEAAPLLSSRMARAALERAINAKLSKVSQDIKVLVVRSIEKSWDLSNKKTHAYLDKRLKAFADGIPSGVRTTWYDPNKSALEQFIKRKSNGFTLSERVFKQTKQAKAIINRQLKEGIKEGDGAAKIARTLRNELLNPTGSPSPGKGVYKSPVKNTQRLARTETNRSYRTADDEAWKKNPIILGYNIELSKTQSKSVKARCEICKALTGPYPVEFIFSGWHPHCLCYKTPILMNDKQMAAYTKLIAEGKDSSEAIQRVRAMKGGGLVRDVPDDFKKWVGDNTDRVRGWAKQPEWIRDNFNKGDIGSGLRNINSKPLKAQVKRSKKSFVPDGLARYEEKLDIKVNRDVFRHLNKETPLINTIDGAYYHNEKNFVNIPFDERRSSSQWKAESVVYHEFGHAADWQNGYRKSAEVAQVMDKYRKLPDEAFKRVTKESWDIGYNAYHSGQRDLSEQTGAFADTIMAVKKNYGYGHSIEYFDIVGRSEAEFIAHAFENRYIGNEFFKNVMPELYDDMIKMVDALLAKRK